MKGPLYIRSPDTLRREFQEIGRSRSTPPADLRGDEAEAWPKGDGGGGPVALGLMDRNSSPKPQTLYPKPSVRVYKGFSVVGCMLIWL